ncbi:MAG: hypothetical protein GXC76_15245 [Rhodanobacteraceae bacterium]|jgi:hypothetical protein|nr:hypothetical protein [Rhodanobacteraceae bacterium]
MAVSLAYATVELGLGGPQWQIIVGFVAAIVLAASLGYRFGRWYCAVDGEEPTFELVLCPVVVFILASLGGSAVACLLMAVQNQVPTLELIAGLPVLALYGVIVVVASAWPAIALSHLVAAAVLAWRCRSAPNNSSKPTPLRGAA